jgi:two-component system sensor kinase FixL
MEGERDTRLMEEVRLLRERLVQKEREMEEMRVGRTFLETLFDGIHEEIMVIDGEYGIRNANRVFKQHHGLAGNEAVGQKCFNVVYGSERPCDFAGRPCPLREAKETGKRVEVTHYRDLGGGDFQEMIRIMYPVAEPGETPRYFMEISRDMTEYRRLIKRLQTSEKGFRTILDTATDGILCIDEGQRITLFNDAAQRIFGYTRDEVLGRNLNMLIPPRYGDHHQFVRRFLETREPRFMGEIHDLTALRKGGGEFPIELGLSHHETDGGVTFTAIIRDMTNQKQLEKKLLQSERLAAVGETVAHVAHEIKNPLMIIGGFSHQIRQGLEDAKAIQKLDMILDEVARLEKLVENLGDFTREYILTKRRADVNALLRDVLMFMEETHDSERYRFEADLCEALEEISCDPDKLKQVFLNVITNGIQAMEAGGTIRVSTDETEGGVEIRISDQGTGIEEEDLDHIFEPFFTTRKEGSGLGLSISYKIVKAHEGDIGAESLPGKGTTFTVNLPRG